MDPARTPLHHVGQPALERRLAASEQLLTIARPQLAWASTLLADIGHVVNFVDRDGVVLVALGTDEALMRAAGLEPGYDWSERRMGTNGAGTALVLEEPVTVVGTEHFVEAFRDCTCTAAPVRDERGSVVAAISITTRKTLGAAQRLTIAVHVAQLIEQELRLRAALRSAQDEARERARVETELRRAVEQTRRLQSLTAALSEAVTPTDVADTVVHHATEAFAAMGTVITRTTADGAMLEIMRAGAMPDEQLTAWGRFPLDAPVPLAEAARHAEPVYIETREEWDARYPQLAGMLEAVGQHALMVMPLVVEGRSIGSLGVAFAQARTFGETDRAFALVVARQCAQALERARLFEAEQRARAEAEAASLAKSELLTVVSHDLRTPLNAIGGYLELLELGVRGSLSSIQLEDLDRIKRNQQRLLALVEDLLDFASLQEDRIACTIEPVPVDEALAAVEHMIWILARQQGLVFEVRPCDGPTLVLANPERLQQVLLNLVGNAVKFTPAGGTVTVACSAAADQVQIDVSDTGPGIPPDQLEAIFEPFVRLPSGGAPDRQGTGMGLAISRKLARAMGGELVATCVPGGGARLSLTLPRAPSTPLGPTAT